MTIEDIVENSDSNSEKAGPAEEAGTRKLRGRKPAYESRAAEFCRELVIWKQTPESLRPTLRELAGTLGTSHQLLGHYLDGLDRWQAKEQAKRIRDRAMAEGREMTMRECYGAIVLPGMFRKIEELRRQAKRGPLNHWQIQMLKLFAKQGFSGAKEILGKCRQMTPQEERQARASERAAAFASAASDNIARIRKEAERGQMCWQDVERLKFFARRGNSGAKEILEKHPQMVVNARLQKTIAIEQLKAAAASRLQRNGNSAPVAKLETSE